jgi:hypothetical protein
LCTDTVDPGGAHSEDPHTGERIGFASLEQRFAFLMEQAEGDAKAARMK